MCRIDFCSLWLDKPNFCLVDARQYDQEKPKQKVLIKSNQIEPDALSKLIRFTHDGWIDDVNDTD